VELFFPVLLDELEELEGLVELFLVELPLFIIDDVEFDLPEELLFEPEF